MKIVKYPVGAVSAIIAIVLGAQYGVWQSVGGTASVVICGMMLLIGWLAPLHTMRD